MIAITIVFFGALKSFFGSSMHMEVDADTKLAEIVHKLGKAKPEAMPIIKQCQLAVNSEIEGYDFVIHEACEIAILPPFSGG